MPTEKASTKRGTRAARNPRDVAISRILAAEAEGLSAPMDIYDAYLKTLPTVPVARCPFTNEIASVSIDDGGIDGPWWDYFAPIRSGDDLPATSFGLTGALKLNGDPEHTEFLVKPGPEVPFVVPEILGEANLKAVLSHLKVGKHDGFTVTYFAQPFPANIGRFNSWGMDRTWYENEEGEPVYYEVNEDDEPLDFELRPWIEREKLYWIAPGDKKLKLRGEVKGCPYLGLQGRRTFVRIQYGEVWEPEL